MNENAVIQHITTSFEGVQTQVVDGNIFFFSGDDHRFPFATLMTNDVNDEASNLNREGVFRLNIGVSKATFQALFGDKTEFDFTAQDELMPHPIYGMMFWVCVLNPSEKTLETVRELLIEAWGLALKKRAKNEV